ncbi:MAG TPA: branched-chain amino acid ABC transporter permease [Solirubrobacteraceae bacterium]|nr:branched-chain amino acid ABC transporter permease [Solirubrobacteraceae bacterium]
MPSTIDLEQFLITGLSLGGVYALSGVGMVVLYRATGVLYLAFGAVGAMGALIAWQLSQQDGWNIWLSFAVAVLFGGVITLVYGMIFGPALAGRDPLVKATATLGLLLILLGVMDLVWPSSGGASRALTVPTDNNTFQVGQIAVTYTQVIALALGLVIAGATAAFLRFTKLGTAMRAMANDREITAALGVPVRRVEAAAWFGCGVLSGVAGVLLSDLIALDSTTLTFLVISTLAATLVARLRSIVITFLAALVIGVITAELTPVSSLSNYRDMTPFVVAAIALLILNRRRVIAVGRQGV